MNQGVNKALISIDLSAVKSNLADLVSMYQASYETAESRPWFNREQSDAP